MTAGAARAPAVRVTLADTWQTYAISAGPGDSVSVVKRIALAAARVAPERASAYQVKFRGALVGDESKSLADLGAGPGASLIVLARHRRPVR